MRPMKNSMMAKKSSSNVEVESILVSLSSYHGRAEECCEATPVFEALFTSTRL
jgi:hypothetical protein